MGLNLPPGTCPKCGIEGLHACPGKKLQKPTPEQEARLKEVVDQLKVKVTDAFENTTFEEAVAAAEASPGIPPFIRDAMVDVVLADPENSVE